MGFSNPQETGRPVKIKNEGLTIATNVASIDLVGSGIDGTALGQDVTATVPGTAGLTYELPVEAVDGSNLIFTFVHEPKFVTRGGLIQEPGGVDYTLAGAGPYTVTFSGNKAAPQTEPLEVVKSWY